MGHTTMDASQLDPRQQAELQEYVQRAQQEALTHQIIEKFTDMAFKKCVAKPGTSLSSYEGECISNSVKRYIASKKFMVQRLVQTQQQQQQSGGGGFMG